MVVNAQPRVSPIVPPNATATTPKRSGGRGPECRIEGLRGRFAGGVGFLVLGDAGDRILPVVTPIGLTLLWLSALLTLYTGYDYFRAGVRHLID